MRQSNRLAELLRRIEFIFRDPQHIDVPDDSDVVVIVEAGFAVASAEGVLGYSVLARPLSKQFWTLSGWKNEAALRTFVQYPPHVRIMTALAFHMGETKFVRWTVKGSELPLSWDDALHRFENNAE